MIRIAGITENDCVNGKGISVSVWFQGCPFHCKNCHNPATWDPKGGYEYDEQKLLEKIVNAISENGIQRNLSFLGGEPFDTEAKTIFIYQLISWVKTCYPNIKIVAWTGYQYEKLLERKDMKYILDNIDYLIDGPYISEERDITLKWRGSRNQRIINLKTGEIEND